MIEAIKSKNLTFEFSNVIDVCFIVIFNCDSDEFENVQQRYIE